MEDDDGRRRRRMSGYHRWDGCDGGWRSSYMATAAMADGAVDTMAKQMFVDFLRTWEFFAVCPDRF